jgi:hypothetical protein
MGEGDNKTLKALEDKLQHWLSKEISTSPLDSQKEELKTLEQDRRKIFLDREKELWLESRALWLQQGDENTKFFNNFANKRKSINTI